MVPHSVTVLAARGGSGKTSTAAGIALAAARRGERTVLIDFDMSAPSLDTLLGVEDRVVYDLGDLLGGGRDVDGVVMPLSAGLSFIPGAFCPRDTAAEVEAVVKRVVDVLRPTRLIFDTSTVSDPVLRQLVGLSAHVLAVSVPEERSLRAVGALVPRLRSWGEGETRLLLNRFSEGVDLRGAVDAATLPLIGLVPDRSPLSVLDTEDVTARAYDNIAARLAGEHVPLLTGVAADRRRALVV